MQFNIWRYTLRAIDAYTSIKVIYSFLCTFRIVYDKNPFLSSCDISPPAPCFILSFSLPSFCSVVQLSQKKNKAKRHIQRWTFRNFFTQILVLINLTTVPFHPFGEGRFKKLNIATSMTKIQKNTGQINSIIYLNLQYKLLFLDIDGNQVRIAQVKIKKGKSYYIADLNRTVMNLKKKSKKIQEKKLIPKNQTLLNFVKKLPEKQQSHKFINEPQIRVPRFTTIPNSSGSTLESYPQNPSILYPKNPQFRDYQYQISIECIKYNTLVCLPTGLGKTHIASILITNFTLWFPQSKIFFLAPTRPLVRQQRQSLKWFYEKIGVQNVFEMNGQINAQKRVKFYETKRVFFATPQTFANDLKQGRINPQQIKLLIFDQAHRAVGNSAYAQSIRFLNKLNLCYRIIGLSATPGNQKQKIQQVINNLNMSKMLCKDEQQPDVKKYFFNKVVHPVIIQPPAIIQQVEQILDQMVTPYLRYLVNVKLTDAWVMKSKINSGLFFVVFQSFNDRKQSLDQGNAEFAYSSLKILKFLIDSKQNLIEHGYETFKSKFFRHIQDLVLEENDDDNEKGQVQQKQSELNEQTNKNNESKASKASVNSKASVSSKTSINPKKVKLPSQQLPKKFKEKIMNSEEYKRIKQLFNPKSNVINHPKLQKLRQILDNFFKQSYQRTSNRFNNYEQNPQRQSKCIVFTHYRSTAHEIKTYLAQSQIVKSELFHGQSKTHIYEDNYNEEGEYQNSKQSVLVLNQKQQISIIEKFKLGTINTLIATSIGQEGLDIGEVDCIVCYDGGNKSPIRSIQRFGRTGRKRDGVVYVLLMKGTEQADYKKGQAKIKAMKKMLKQGNFDFYGYNSSLLQQQSHVPIQIYDNQMMEPVKSLKKEKPQKQEKPKRGKKNKKQFQIQVIQQKIKLEQNNDADQTRFSEISSDNQEVSQQNQLQKNINKEQSSFDFLDNLFQKQHQDEDKQKQEKIQCQNQSNKGRKSKSKVKKKKKSLKKYKPKPKSKSKQKKQLKIQVKEIQQVLEIKLQNTGVQKPSIIKKRMSQKSKYKEQSKAQKSQEKSKSKKSKLKQKKKLQQQIQTSNNIDFQQKQESIKNFSNNQLIESPKIVKLNQWFFDEQVKRQVQTIGNADNFSMNLYQTLPEDWQSFDQNQNKENSSEELGRDCNELQKVWKIYSQKMDNIYSQDMQVIDQDKEEQIVKNQLNSQIQLQHSLNFYKCFDDPQKTIPQFHNSELKKSLESHQYSSQGILEEKDKIKAPSQEANMNLTIPRQRTNRKSSKKYNTSYRNQLFMEIFSDDKGGNSDTDINISQKRKNLAKQQYKQEDNEKCQDQRNLNSVNNIHQILDNLFDDQISQLSSSNMNPNEVIHLANKNPESAFTYPQNVQNKHNLPQDLFDSDSQSQSSMNSSEMLQEFLNLNQLGNNFCTKINE